MLQRIYCYLDICIDGVYVGTLTFKLYSDILPKTCENFENLCLGSKGPLLSYKGSRIHRIVKEGWLQGGDIQYKTGGGGFSIFCNPLEDEAFGISHNRRGVLSMANCGKDTNGSQFFVTLKPSTWMDTHYVAFGRLIEGNHVLKVLENSETLYECPLKKIEIKGCGRLDLGDVGGKEKYEVKTSPQKKQKTIETISHQLIRLIMEALTKALNQREIAQDVLDDGDVPSKMNLQMYFQGFYSLPQELLERSAKFLRNLRRQLYRGLKPSATEIVEVLLYDILMACLSRMTTLDDVKRTIGDEKYKKMIAKIKMKLEKCHKPCVKRLVNQIVSTAESMVALVTKKVVNMKKKSAKLKAFQDKMQNWVQSFVLQETFSGDSYYISDRSPRDVIKKSEEELPKREGKMCCDKKGKKDLEWEKIKSKFPPEEVCCLGSRLALGDIKLENYFSSCRYDLKTEPKTEEEQIPLMALIEIGRFKLKWMRKPENRVKTEERVCVEKKVRKWMSEVVYTPESSWIKDVIYEKNEVVFDHLEEILYGAMTAGLLEMYYFYEQYLKTCGLKNKKLVLRTVYPEDSEEDDSETDEFKEETKGEENIIEAVTYLEAAVQEKKKTIHPCTCGHPCCVCPGIPSDEPTPSERSEEFVEEEELYIPPVTPPLSCPSGFELVDLNAELAEKLSLKPEEIDVRSFKWLKPYILEKGCDMKTEFATQAHKWLEGERFSYKGFFSKHSLITRASLLSLSFSLAELITEKNNMKLEIKNFIFDLWDLYFKEMFKEALLEFPPEGEVVGEEILGEEVEEKGESVCEGIQGITKVLTDEKCKKIVEETPPFDFSNYCEQYGYKFPPPCDEQEEGHKEEERKGEELEDEYQDEIPISKSAEKYDSTEKVEKKEQSQIDLESSIDSESSLKEGDESPKKDLNVDSEPDAKKSDKKDKHKEKKPKTPIIIEELEESLSEDESRKIPPYVLPFWVKFLTELTKQALGTIAKLSRLPKRIFFQTDSETNFDENIKEWFEFNCFNPQPTKGKEIKDFIALHHKSLINLEETERSFLKKKKYVELLNRCTRITSAETVADEIVLDVLENAMKDQAEEETLNLFVSNLFSSAITSSHNLEDTEGVEQRTFDTNSKDSLDTMKDEDED